MKQYKSSRAFAAYLISRVISYGESLAELIPHCKNHAEANFIQALCYGVCRYYYRLTAIADQLLNKPLKDKDQDIEALLLIGLYQLLEMNLPDYAAVTETVAAATELKKPWAKNLINALLRRFQREQSTLMEVCAREEMAKYMHPVWLIEKIQLAWGEQAEIIFSANNQQAPLTLRVNQQKIAREDYLKILHANKIDAELDLDASAGIILTKACDVMLLPDFKKGACSVQDAAAQLAAPLLAPQPGHRVLDACAAPGGKTTHLLEYQPEIHVTALDISADRCEYIQQNLARLNLSATVIAADALKIETWWDKQLFDRILLDAPCSATGVIRRHPDIKLLRRAEDIIQLQETQYQLLTNLWPLLIEEGLLLYATCSILPEENEVVIEKFLSQTPTAKVLPIKASWGIEKSVGRQILPGENNKDGFYYCLLKKAKL